MDINCKSCGKKIGVNAPFCVYCGAENVPDEIQIVSARLEMKERNQKVLLCVFGGLAAIIVICVILSANLLMPWQFEAHANKRAILEYVNWKYPGAEIVREYYRTAELKIWTSPPDDAIVFELDGISFVIRAQNGKVQVDGYDSAKAIAQFDEIIQDGFMKPKGITAQSYYWFSDAIPNDSPYTGELGIAIGVYDQGSTPQEVGWLYDFYEYWESNADFLSSYGILISISENRNIIYQGRFSSNNKLTNEQDFYEHFKPV